MTRVLQYGLSNNKGGIENIAIRVFRTINKEKFQIDFLIAGDEIAYEDEINILGGNIFKIKKVNKNILKRYYQFYKFFKENAKNYDTIHCSYMALYGLEVIIFSKIFGIPNIIVHARGSSHYSSNTLNKIRHKINKFVVDKIANQFIACSDEAAKFLFTENRVKLKEYKILNNFIDTEKFFYNIEKSNEIRKKLLIEDCFVIGHVGVFLPVKNHRFIIDVFNEVKKCEKESKLLLIGGGDSTSIDEIKRYARKLKLHNDILFIGSVDNVEDYFNAMDVFIFPSLWEGFGNVLIEAQANGLISIASNSIPKNVSIFDNKIIFKSLDRGCIDWANEILTMKSNKNRILNKKEKIIIKQWDIKHCVNEYEKIYEKYN